MTPFEQAKTIIHVAQSICFFTGAGLSAQSGISTFRSHNNEDSLWSRFDPATLATEAAFRRNPEQVYQWYNWRRRKLALAEPNAAHRIIAQCGLPVITQNVDNLLELAGIMDENLCHLHGSIGMDKCLNLKCDHQEHITDLLAPPALRHCPLCGDWLRPGVVWFGESLNPVDWAQAELWIEQTDCLIVVGTSGAVYPAAGLVTTASTRGAKIIIIDPDPGPLSGDVILVADAVSALSALETVLHR